MADLAHFGSLAKLVKDRRTHYIVGLTGLAAFLASDLLAAESDPQLLTVFRLGALVVALSAGAALVVDLVAWTWKTTWGWRVEQGRDRNARRRTSDRIDQLDEQELGVLRRIIDVAAGKGQALLTLDPAPGSITKLGPDERLERLREVGILDNARRDRTPLGHSSRFTVVLSDDTVRYLKGGGQLPSPSPTRPRR